MLSASAAPGDKPAPIAPSVARELKEQTNAKKAIPARLVPVPSLSGLADKRGEPMPDTTSSRSSPWSQSVAGGAARNPLEDNEITTVEPAILEPPKRASQSSPPSASQSAVQNAIRTEEIRRERWRELQNANETQEDQPSIARVGFTPGAPNPGERPPPPKVSSLPAKRPLVARDATDTDQIPVGDLRGRVRTEEQELATEDTIDAATLAAQRLTRARVPVLGITEAVPQKKPSLPPFPDGKRPPRSGSQTEELLANRPVQGNAHARASEGDLLTPLAQLAPNRFEEPVSETRLAAPGELAGREKKKQASDTIAAPGELAGIMKNATRPPASSPARTSPPLSPFDAPTNNLSPRDVPVSKSAHDVPVSKSARDVPVSKSAHDAHRNPPSPYDDLSTAMSAGDLTQSRASHDPRLVLRGPQTAAGLESGEPGRSPRPADVRANDQRSVVPSRAAAVPAAPTPSRAAPPVVDPRATRAQQPIFEQATKQPGAFEPRASDVQARNPPPPQRTNPAQPIAPQRTNPAARTMPPARRDGPNLATKGSIIDPGETIAAPGALAGLVNDLGIAKPQVPAYRPDPPKRAQTSDLIAPPKIDLTAPAALPGPPALDSSLPMRTRTEPEAHGMRQMPGSDTTDPELSSDRTPPPRAITMTGEDSLDSGLLSMPGSALPAGDTLIPQRASDLLAQVEPNALTAAVAEPSVTFAVPGLARRIAADLIDLAVIGALVIAPISLGVFGKNLSAISWLDPDDVSNALISGAIVFPLAIFLILVFVASSLSHALAGRSLGKLATGLELVVKKSGRRPSLVRTVIRALLGIVASLALGMSYLWLIVDRKSRTLHDVLSGTVPVISSSRREI